MRSTLRLALPGAILLLAGCTAIGHIESQSMLEDGVRDLYAAQSNALAAVTATGGALDQAFAPQASITDLTPDGARQVLAESAQKDIDAVQDPTQSLQPLDKISYLYRASIKSWHAASAGASASTTSNTLGQQLCDQDDLPFRPERDCAMFELGQALNLAETASESLARTRLKAIAAEGLSKDCTNEPADTPQICARDAISLMQDIRALDAALVGPISRDGTLEDSRLAGAPASSSKLLKAFADRQMLIYWCQAVNARWLIYDRLGPNLNGTQREIAGLLIDRTDDAAPITSKYSGVIQFLIREAKLDDAEATAFVESLKGVLVRIEKVLAQRIAGVTFDDRLQMCRDVAQRVAASRSTAMAAPDIFTQTGIYLP